MDMRTFGWMAVCAVCLTGLMLFGQGCARKSVDFESDTGVSGQSGEYLANGVQANGTESTLSQMSAEEMEEYRLREEERRKEAEAEQADRKAQEKQAIKDLRERIHFAFDSYELRVEARQALKKKAEIMDRHPGIDLIIEGHCDGRGTDEYNLALGERRARAAYEFMVLLGVDPQRLSIISYGEERPLDPRSNEEAWAKNRRCEFRAAQ